MGEHCSHILNCDDSSAVTGAGVSGSAAGVPSSSSTASAEMKVTSNLHTLFTGIVFGLQPDALFVIVPALALPTKAAATAYILMFVFGTVAAMGSYTAFIGEQISSCHLMHAELCGPAVMHLLVLTPCDHVHSKAAL